jgi:hypothetical protein
LCGAEQRPAPKPRVARHAPPRGNSPRVELGIEELDDRLDRNGIGRQPFGLALVVEDTTANVSVKPDQVGDRGMLGARFE